MFEVWKLNACRIYEKVVVTHSEETAERWKDFLLKNGVFAQVCKAGEMSINGGVV